ncbi:MAG: hypothetical protein H6Q72_164 [Firmicutes bacterium]|nr:hypothetical protein [Bacillota bacterium]
MSNQLIQWVLFIAPWFTLSFMKGKEVKRYIASVFLSVVLTTIVHDVGITFGFGLYRKQRIHFTK